MANALEKQFFDAFGIESIKRRTCSNAGDCPDEYNIVCDNCEYWRIIREDYPEITDRILLKLICIANEQDTYSTTTNINNIKARTLKMLLGALKFSTIYESPNRRRLFIKRVHALFKEDSND